MRALNTALLHQHSLQTASLCMVSVHTRCDEIMLLAYWNRENDKMNHTHRTPSLYLRFFFFPRRIRTGHKNAIIG